MQYNLLKYFQCIIVRLVPPEMLKTPNFALGFLLFTWNLANVNVCIKNTMFFLYYYSFTSSPASKLFDYEKESRPRSRRELVQSNISAETSRIPSPSGRLTGASSRTGHRGSLTPAISLTEGNNYECCQDGFKETPRNLDISCNR